MRKRFDDRVDAAGGCDAAPTGTMMRRRLRRFLALAVLSVTSTAFGSSAADDYWLTMDCGGINGWGEHSCTGNTWNACFDAVLLDAKG